jgi:hypothetical protein
MKEAMEKRVHYKKYDTISGKCFDDIIKSHQKNHDCALYLFSSTFSFLLFYRGGSNLKLISRRDIRKLGEIVLSGFNYLENLDSLRKFLRRSTAKWMHPGTPSGFPPPLIPLHRPLSLSRSQPPSCPHRCSSCLWTNQLHVCLIDRMIFGIEETLLIL